MSLLREIQTAASSPTVRTADLLRMCKILSARLKSKELSIWVDHELNGYGDVPVPAYRVIRHLEALGNFSGPFGSKLTNAPIATMGLPDYVQQWVTDVKLRAGIALYEDLAKSDQNPQVNWPPEVTFMVQRETGLMYDGYVCLQAWSVITHGTILELLDTVRNKVLSFSLDIEQENPNAGEADVNTTPVPAAVVHNVFNQNFYSPVGNVAAGSREFKQRSNG